MSHPGGARVGRPVPAALVAGYFCAALACWVAATVAPALAAPQLAVGPSPHPRCCLQSTWSRSGSCGWPLRGALHVLPTLSRNDASVWRGWVALPLLCAGPALAAGIAHDLEPLVWPAALAETLAVGVEVLVVGALAGSSTAVAAGAGLLVASAAITCAGALVTVRAGRSAIRLRSVALRA